MMNGNVKIGMKTPDFEAETTYGKNIMKEKIIIFSKL